MKIPKLKPSTNCYLSHRNAILKAKQLDWPYVCVFEDDAYPIMGIEKKLDQCLLEVPDNCATLILGYSNMITSSTYSKTLSN